MMKKILYISAACFLLIGTKIFAMGEGEFTRYLKNKEIDTTKLIKNIIDKLKSAGMKKDTEYYERILSRLNNKSQVQQFKQILQSAKPKYIVNMVKYFNYDKDMPFYKFGAKNRESHERDKAKMRDKAIKFLNALPHKLKTDPKVLKEFVIKEQEGFLTDIYEKNYLNNNNKKEKKEAFDFLKTVVYYIGITEDKEIAKIVDVERLVKVFQGIEEEIKKEKDNDLILSQKKKIKSLQKQINRSSNKEADLTTLKKQFEQQKLYQDNQLNEFKTDIISLQRELYEKNKLINELEEKNEELNKYFVDEEDYGEESIEDDFDYKEEDDAEASTEDDTDIEEEYDDLISQGPTPQRGRGSSISNRQSRNLERGTNSSTGRSRRASRNNNNSNSRRRSSSSSTSRNQGNNSRGRRQINSREKQDNSRNRGRRIDSSSSTRSRSRQG